MTGCSSSGCGRRGIDLRMQGGRVEGWRTALGRWKGHAAAGGDARGPAGARRQLHLLLLLLPWLLWVTAMHEAHGATPKTTATTTAGPWNIIVILVDDLGWTDLGCMGSTFHETPNLDRLAAQGVKFTQAYSACTVCSPTRAALMTGKYPARLHLTDWIAGHVRPKAKLKVPDWTKQLALGELTLAEALKPAGYATASIGKWHLGGPEYYPEKQGFDRNVGGYFRGQPPSFMAPHRIPTLPEGPDGEFLTDRESAEAVRFIRENQHRPFLLYLPHYAVHEPIAGKREVIEKYQRKAQPSQPQHNATYAALLESVDDSVGRIGRCLEELRLADRTVIFFTSDNGGLIQGRQPPTSNVPLRAGKGSAYEGGVRVPLLIKWPGVTAPGTTNDTPVITPDLFATALEIAGVRPPRPVDGRSLVPVLKRTASLRRDAIYWHYPHYHPGGATPYGAMRAGDLKLIEFYEDHHVELYNLRDDPGETVNLAAAKPGEARRLQRQLARWRREMKAQMPTRNPDWEDRQKP